jgi:multiple sugar transport system substrate-binding protein
VGDATPDLAQIGNTWIPEFAALGALEPLDEWISRSEVVDSAAYFGGIWSTNTVGDTVYGVPWYVDTRVIFYRKDILARAGFECLQKSKFQNDSFPKLFPSWVFYMVNQIML